MNILGLLSSFFVTILITRNHAGANTIKLNCQGEELSFDASTSTNLIDVCGESMTLSLLKGEETQCGSEVWVDLLLSSVGPLISADQLRGKEHSISLINTQSISTGNKANFWIYKIGFRKTKLHGSILGVN